MTKTARKPAAKPAAPVARDRRLEPVHALALIVALALICLAYAFMPTAQAAGEASPSQLPVQRVVVEVHVVQDAPVYHAPRHAAHHCGCRH